MQLHTHSSGDALRTSSCSAERQVLTPCWAPRRCSSSCRLCHEASHPRQHHPQRQHPRQVMPQPPCARSTSQAWLDSILSEAEYFKDTYNSRDGGGTFAPPQGADGARGWQGGGGGAAGSSSSGSWSVLQQPAGSRGSDSSSNGGGGGNGAGGGVGADVGSVDAHGGVLAPWYRKTKLVCTIGPATSSREGFRKLADAGMNVARLNMSHGTHESHKAVIDMAREYNASGRGCIATMLDTKGPEVRSGDLAEPIAMERGQPCTFTIREGATGKGGVISVNYDGFIHDVSVGDELLVDGGIISFVVRGKTDTDVQVEVVDGGVMESRRHLNVRGKSATLPAITDKDWQDLEFGAAAQVDAFALSFVKDAAVIHELKAWLQQRGSKIKIIAKIESADSVKNLDGILDAADGAMVARGDLGAELPLQDVPYWQSKIIQGCRARGKFSIVATNMLESMVCNPAPTRAEVSDIAIAVREGADAIMLSGETAYGKYPVKSVAVQSAVALRTEAAMTRYQGARRYGTDEAPPIDWLLPPRTWGAATPSDGALSEMFAYHSVTMANTVRAPLLVFSRQGNMPALLSHYRPNSTIFAFTDSPQVQRHLAFFHGVVPLLIQFSESAEGTFDAALSALVARGYLGLSQVVALVMSGRKPIWRSASTHTIQVRRVEQRHLGSTSSLEDD